MEISSNGTAILWMIVLHTIFHKILLNWCLILNRNQELQEEFLFLEAFYKQLLKVYPIELPGTHNGVVLVLFHIGLDRLFQIGEVGTENIAFTLNFNFRWKIHLIFFSNLDFSIIILYFCLFAVKSSNSEQSALQISKMESHKAKSTLKIIQE